RHAKEAGADAALSVCPYYNKPSQEGMYLHFKAVAEAVDIPVIIYNIPGRSIVDMSVETMARLAKLENIVGVKDATADLARPLAGRVAMGDDFCQLSGEDATVAAFLAQGGHGCISVTSNVAPKQCSELHTAWQQGDTETFNRLRDLLMPLHEAIFCEPSPAPAKYGVHLLGKAESDVRLPVAPLTEAGQAQMRDAMVHVGLIN
ncbi:MAG: 4-hydroxy-tetrahydrodipicolinate synthase, partial [Rhodospirillaceae bacterium]|nr:4-hydroxy-tetrahydrodipicolinate synthase [Rhodospirillaceae bacterium]